ncbi:hypothetical protein FN846DRAFT_914650 [Sphaerosporella brunnea]|uniref:Uncharacterized protein n=1 Tax=Sphaerosporella brunnea TaxID=1250544 RepID=A0A5J5ED31_9PEZI|nr:hypothetical protein FN846DRAFT_914650 [Sphaerosporella brunnea]
MLPIHAARRGGYAPSHPDDPAQQRSPRRTPPARAPTRRHLHSSSLTRQKRLDGIRTAEIAMKFGIIDEWKAPWAAKQSQDTHMRDASPEVTSAAPALPLADFAKKEGYDPSLAKLVQVVLELKESTEELSVQNSAVQAQLSETPRVGDASPDAAPTSAPLASAEPTATPPAVTAAALWPLNDGDEPRKSAFLGPRLAHPRGGGKNEKRKEKGKQKEQEQRAPRV